MKKNSTKKSKGIVLIRKSNDLIESRFKFDIWEMRIFLMLIAQIRREDSDFNVYRIWYSDVAETFRLNKKRGYTMLRQAVKSLMNKSFYVQYSENGKPREVQYHILRKIDYSTLENENMINNQEYVDVKIEEEMKPFLLQLQKSFTTYDIKNVVNLGVYAIRIYELLKQYESIGHRAFDYEDLKQMFELEKEYPRFSTFYQRIIEPAVKEINDTTDLMIYEVEKMKRGKSISGVRFRFRHRPVETFSQSFLDTSKETLKPKKNIKLFDVAETTDNDKRFTQFYARVVENMGITPTVFLDLLKSFDDAQIEQAIRVTNRAKMEGMIKTNLSGFFVQALKNGYTDQKEEQSKKEKKEEAQKRLKEQLDILEREKQNRIIERIKDLTMANPSLTLSVIETLKFTEAGKKTIHAEEKKLGRPLEIEDFRQIKPLRFLVIDTIFIQNITAFADILKDYEEKVNQLTLLQF